MRISEKIIITEKMVEDFSNLSGDKNPIHLDEEYAKGTSFNTRIVQGLLVSSFFSKIISNSYPGNGSIYLRQNLNFINPCFIGDEIEVIIELEKKEGNKFFLNTNILRKDTIIVEGSALVLKK